MDEISSLKKRLEEAERKAKETAAAATTIVAEPAPAPATGEKRKERDDETLSLSRGLKSASYYKQVSQTEGMLRKRLHIIDENVKVKALSGACETQLPCLVIDAVGVRRSLAEQHYEVSDAIIPAVCACGRGEQCELGHADCYPRSRIISWANAPSWKGTPDAVADAPH